MQAAGETENHGNADEESKREQRHIPFHLDGENEEEDDELLAPEEMKMEACIMSQSRSSPNDDQWDLGNELVVAASADNLNRISWQLEAITSAEEEKKELPKQSPDKGTIGRIGSITKDYNPIAAANKVARNSRLITVPKEKIQFAAVK